MASANHWLVGASPAIPGRSISGSSRGEDSAEGSRRSSVGEAASSVRTASWTSAGSSRGDTSVAALSLASLHMLGGNRYDEDDGRDDYTIGEDGDEVVHSRFAATTTANHNNDNGERHDNDIEDGELDPENAENDARSSAATQPRRGYISSNDTYRPTRLSRGGVLRSSSQQQQFDSRGSSHFAARDDDNDSLATAGDRVGFDLDDDDSEHGIRGNFESKPMLTTLPANRRLVFPPANSRLLMQ